MKLISRITNKEVDLITNMRAEHATNSSSCHYIIKLTEEAKNHFYYMEHELKNEKDIFIKKNDDGYYDSYSSDTRNALSIFR
jgi:hypothetical protein